MLVEQKRNDKIIAMLKKHSDELLAKGPQACRDYLISLGIYYQDGTLTENYGGKN